MTDSKMPAKVWLRVCGGGTRFPGHQGFVSVTGDSIVTEGRTVYIRADLVEPLVEALRDILPFIPKSSAAEGGPNARSANVAAADKVRAALAAYTAAQSGQAQTEARG